MEDAEFIAQLAQFSSLEQLTHMQKTREEISTKSRGEHDEIASPRGDAARIGAARRTWNDSCGAQAGTVHRLWRARVSRARP